ncbi:hypothetical protein FRC18_008492 [Serendipita sp. 400]|nr:hypothetical protein FRC18_008492 [Serendipita sp. 400]
MESDILELATKLSQVQDPASKISYLRDLMAACIRLQHLLIDNANPKVAKSRRTPPKVVTLQYDRINSLPTEILLCIFEQYIIRTEVRKNATLMRVCRRWRVLVYTTPTLWRRVKIEPTDCSVPSLVSWKHLAEVCIARSGEVPLELDLDFARMKGLEFRTADPQRILAGVCYDGSTITPSRYFGRVHREIRRPQVEQSLETYPNSVG